MASRPKDALRGRTGAASRGGIVERCTPILTVSRPKRAKLAMCPIVRDVVAAMAACAHEDADAGRSDKETALRNDVSRRTAHRWRKSGRGSPTDVFALFMLTTDDPWRLVAHVKALAKRVNIEDETREELIRRTRELLAQEKVVEGMDSARDLSRGVSWKERAALKERDAAIDEELAARFRRLAELKVPESEVFG